MLEEQVAEVVVDRVGQAVRLLGGLEVGEVVAQPGQTLAVARLPADDGSVELALGPALRALDPGAPGQLVEGTELEPLVEAGLAALTTRERTAGEDVGRIEA